MVTFPTPVDPVPKIWFKCGDWWRCHTCSKRIWTGLSLLWWGFLGRVGQGPKQAKNWLEKTGERDRFSFYCDKRQALGWGALCMQDCSCALNFLLLPKKGDLGFLKSLPRYRAEEERGLGVVWKLSAVKHQEWSQLFITVFVSESSFPALFSS